MAMAQGFYNQPRPVIPNNEGPEGPGAGKGSNIPTPGGSGTPAVSGPAVAAAVVPAGFSTASGLDRGGNRGGNAGPGGGPQALNIPRSLAANPLVNGATNFAKNALPELRANCAAIGKFIAMNPGSATQ